MIIFFYDADSFFKSRILSLLSSDNNYQLIKIIKTIYNHQQKILL